MGTAGETGGIRRDDADNSVDKKVAQCRVVVNESVDTQTLGEALSNIGMEEHLATLRLQVSSFSSTPSEQALTSTHVPYRMSRL